MPRAALFLPLRSPLECPPIGRLPPRPLPRPAPTPATGCAPARLPPRGQTSVVYAARSNRCARDRRGALVRSPASSPADTPHAAQWPSSGAALRTAGPYLPAIGNRGPHRSPGIGTGLWPFRAPAVGPAPARSLALLPAVRAATGETPPLCPTGS